MGLSPGCHGGHRAKQHAVPVHVEEAFAIVVPDGVDAAGGAQPLPVANKALDVPERGFGNGKDLVPVGVARRHPGLNAGLGERAQSSCRSRCVSQ